MPIAKIQLPDGRIGKFEVPEGTTPEQVLEFAKGMDVPKESAPAQPSGDAPGMGERFLRGLKDPLDAGAQMLTRALPDSVVAAGNDVAQALNESPYVGRLTKMLGIVPATQQSIDADIKSAEQDYQKRRGDAGFDWMRLGGNIAGVAPLIASAPTTIPGAMASGAVAGTLQPVTEGEFYSEKAKQAGLGMAGGLAGNLIGKGISRVIAPKVAPDVKMLMDRGVTPTPGQIVGGGAKALEEKMTSVPLLGDAIKGGQRRAIQDFNRAVYDDILKPLGISSPKGVGRDAVREVGDSLSQAYDDVLKGATFTVDRQFAGEIGNLRSMVQGLGPKEVRAFENFMRDRVAKALGPNGTMDGQSFKQLESALSKEASKFASSTDAYQKSLGEAFGEALSSLRSAFERSNGGQIGQRLRDINLGWAKLVRLEKAAGMQGAAEGIFTPANLSSAVKAADSSARGRAFARGDALLQELSDPAKAVIGNVYPDSGTAGRLAAMLMAGAAGGGAAINPVATAAAALPMVPYTPLGQRLAAALLAKRPGFAPQVASGFLKTLPAVQAGTAGAFAQY